MKRIKFKYFAALFVLSFAFLPVVVPSTNTTVYAAPCQNGLTESPGSEEGQNCIEIAREQPSGASDCDIFNDVPRTASTDNRCVAIHYCQNGSVPASQRTFYGCPASLMTGTTSPGEASEGVANTYVPDCNDPGGLNPDNCGIVKYVQIIIRVLTALFGIVVAIMIVYGGIRYTMSRDDPQAVQTAKNTIRNAVLALVFYIFSVGFLNYIIPGGIL